MLQRWIWYLYERQIYYEESGYIWPWFMKIQNFLEDWGDGFGHLPPQFSLIGWNKNESNALKNYKGRSKKKIQKFPKNESWFRDKFILKFQCFFLIFFMLIFYPFLHLFVYLTCLLSCNVWLDIDNMFTWWLLCTPNFKSRSFKVDSSSLNLEDSKFSWRLKGWIWSPPPSI